MDSRTSYLFSFPAGASLPARARADRPFRRTMRVPSIWDTALEAAKRRAERLRPSPIRVALVQAPVLSTLRQRIVPRHWSQSLKGFWRAQIEPPVMESDLIARLREIFDADLAQLGSWLGIPLDCENFHAMTLERSLDWMAGRGQTGR